jgi:uncharacterized protein
MIVDVDRHVAVDDYRRILAHMDASWRAHFDRTEFLGSIVESSNHMRVSNRFGLAPESAGPTGASVSILLPHQAIAINAWADQVAALEFVRAFNSFSRDELADARALPTIVVSPADPAWSAGEIRRRAAEGGFGAIALPLGPALLGSQHYDPIYAAAEETGLTVIAHFSGVEGLYAGAQGLGGSVHRSPFARKILLPQLAESNITSLAFEGAFERFPGMRMLFSGFGFSWLPALLWRMDREWRTFRHDIPWVRSVPSEYVKAQVWLSTWPIREATMGEDWGHLFHESDLAPRIVFGSHDPFDGDPIEAVRTELGDDADTVLGNGAALLPLKVAELS